MLILRCHTIYDNVLKLDPHSGATEFASRETTVNCRPIQGHFVNLHGNLACFYKWDDKVFFRTANRVSEIPSDAKAELREDVHTKTLTISAAGLEICCWPYSKPQHDLIDALRWFEEEDVDFGMFVSNVINDKSRLQRLFG